jgi:hypothetical protein
MDRPAGTNCSPQATRAENAQDADVQDDWPVAARRQRDRAPGGSDGKERNRADQGPDGCGPQRRQIFQDGFGHRPCGAPAQGNGAKEQNGFNPAQRMPAGGEGESRLLVQGGPDGRDLGVQASESRNRFLHLRVPGKLLVVGQREPSLAQSF